MTLQERKTLALDLRRQGYNCAQAVIMAFPDVTGLDADTAARLSAALGSGVGGSREICGAINAAAIVEGFRHGSAPADKVPAMKGAGALVERFAALNGGAVRCADLKGVPGKRPCDELVTQAVEILHDSLQ